MSSHLHLAPAASAAPGRAARAPATLPIRVVVADSQPLSRGNLRVLLQAEGGIEVVGEAGDFATLLADCSRLAPHVLVFDPDIADGRSLDAVARLRERAPSCQIVVLTMEDSLAYAQRALDAGAIGLVLKELGDRELAPAVRAAARGEDYVSATVGARLDALRRKLVEDRLSAREVEVLRLIALGYTSVEIARKLRLSPRTIETHRARIHRKLGFAKRSELVRYALRRGLIGA